MAKNDKTTVTVTSAIVQCVLQHHKLSMLEIGLPSTNPIGNYARLGIFLKRMISILDAKNRKNSGDNCCYIGKLKLSKSIVTTKNDLFDVNGNKRLRREFISKIKILSKYCSIIDLSDLSMTMSTPNDFSILCIKHLVIPKKIIIIESNDEYDWSTNDFQDAVWVKHVLFDMSKSYNFSLTNSSCDVTHQCIGNDNDMKKFDSYFNWFDSITAITFSIKINDIYKHENHRENIVKINEIAQSFFNDCKRLQRIIFMIAIHRSCDLEQKNIVIVFNQLKNFIVQEINPKIDSKENIIEIDFWCLNSWIDGNKIDLLEVQSNYQRAITHGQRETREIQYSYNQHNVQRTWQRIESMINNEMHDEPKFMLVKLSKKIHNTRIDDNAEDKLVHNIGNRFIDFTYKVDDKKNS